MAAPNERVMDMVRREIEKNPSIPSQELFEKAKKMDASMKRLNIRQFHATYPLQVKRLSKGGARRRGRPRKAAAAAPVKRGRRRRAAAKAAPVKRGRRPGRPPGRAAGRPPGRPRGRPAGRARAAAAAPAQAAQVARRDGASSRDAVRAILLQFASEVAGAEGKADIVQVLGTMERYVDRLVQATSS